MLTSISEDLKKIFLFGIGAMALTAEKSKVLIDELVAKGELTVEQGKVLNEELIHNIKKTIKDNVTVVSTEAPPTVDEMAANIDKLTDDDFQALKEKIEILEREKAQKQAAYSEPVHTSNDEDQ